MSGVAINHDDIRWRVSNTWQKGDTKMGMLVGYIDARTCMEALDTLDPNWSAVHGDPIIVGNELMGVPCALTVNGVTRSDVGMPSSQDPIKGAYSDALKRAAVHFDIGRELYELPKIAVECEVGANGKVKGPKAVPTYHNGRWSIDRKYGWVKYDREPEDQPEQRRGAQASSPNAAAPVRNNQYRRAELAALLKEREVDADYAQRVADRIGIPATERPMRDESMDRLIEAIESEQAASAHAAAPTDTPQAESSVPAAATTPDPEDKDSSPGPASGSASAISMDDVLAAAGPGAEEVPPLPEDDPEGYRAWFDRQPREVRADLRAKGRSPKKATVTA